MTPVAIPKFQSIVVGILQSLGIIGGLIVSIHFSNVFFALIIIIFTLSYVFLIFVSKKVKVSSTVNPDNPKSPDCEAFFLQLEKHLDVSVRSKLQIIPVLTEQLKAVINQTDEAAGGLTEAFIGISRQAKKQMHEVQGLFGNISDQTTGNNILLQTQQNLREIQTNFSALTTFFEKSIKLITEVVEQLHKVDSFALNIEKIGQTTNILALNASIVAAHSGEAGLGFKVIASEIKGLSQDSQNSIKEITEITEDLTSKVQLIKEELESVNLHARTIGTRTDELFGQTSGTIGNTLNEIAGQIKVIASDAEGLTKDISKAVVSIQFQDITRQRIEHVIAPLETLNKEITESVNKIINKEIDVAQTMGLSSLMSQYTMESEREILRKFDKQS